MIDTEYDLLPEMKKRDTFAILLSYIIWDSKFPHGNQFVSLIHADWAYAIDGNIFDKILDKYPNMKQHLPYSAVTTESLRFCYYKISLNMLPDDLKLTHKDRERYSYCYYPYANRPQSFIIYSAYHEEKSKKEVEAEEIESEAETEPQEEAERETDPNKNTRRDESESVSESDSESDSESITSDEDI